jgi:hypothetical protein
VTPRGVAHHDGSEAWLDRAVAVACGLTTGLVVLLTLGWVEPFLPFREFDNVYFQTDCSLVYSNMTERLANHYRTGMHPLFSILTWPIVSALGAAGVAPFAAVGALLTLNAAGTGALAYLVLRRLGLAPFDAATFALSLAGSVAVVFFGNVPETFAFGGTTILLMLWIVGSARPGVPALVLGNAATMSMTLTNFMVGVAGTLRLDSKDRKTALKVWALAGAIVASFSLLSKLVFRSSGYAGDFRRYVQWVRTPQLSDVRSFFVHSTVMPATVVRPPPDHLGFLEAVAEAATVGSGGLLGIVATVGWLALLGAGLYAAATRAENRRLRDVLLISVAGQLGLHLCFADGPFLFSAHFAPLLLLLAAHARFLPVPTWPARLVTASVLGMIALNNLAEHRSITRRLEVEVLPWLEEHGTARVVGTDLPRHGRP